MTDYSDFDLDEAASRYGGPGGGRHPRQPSSSTSNPPPSLVTACTVFEDPNLLAVEEDMGDVGDEARAPLRRAPLRRRWTGMGKRERRARLGRQVSLQSAASVSASPGSSLDHGSVGAGPPAATASQESVGSEASQGDWVPGSQSSGAGWASSHDSAHGRSSGRRVEQHRRRRRQRWLAAEFRAAGSDVASSQKARGSAEEAEEGALQGP